MTQHMHQLAAKGSEEGLRRLFESSKNRQILNINAPDGTGETILHRAARQDNARLVQALLELGADPFVENRKGKMPLELARDEIVKAFLREAPMVHSNSILPASSTTGRRLEGYLHKWTNYAEGYKRRWFVLEDGVLSYYKTQADYPVSCRGSIRLQWAKVQPHHSDRLRFEVTALNDGSMHFHLRSDSPADAKRWIIALSQDCTDGGEDCDAGKSIKQKQQGDSDESLSDPPDQRRQARASKHSKLVGETLDQLCELEILIRSAIEEEEKDGVLSLEETTFLIQKIREGLLTCQEREAWWQSRFETDLGQRRLLEDALRTLAVENNKIETLARIHAIGGEDHLVQAEQLSPGEMEEFYDALEQLELQQEGKPEMISPSRIEMDISFIEEALGGYPDPPRELIPASSKGMPPVSLWSILKNAIGKDLTKIPVPVNYSEPLSMLQRLCEEMDYSNLLDLAYTREDPVERLQYIAAFAISSYASTEGRITKPFNPLLGETFEYVSRQRGFRYISEQVSHHPPISACYCESARYRLWAEVKVKSKFWGKSMELVPEGTTHLILHGDHYSWRKVTTSVNNIIVGKLWLDHHGLMRIVNHTKGYVCEVEFIPAGWRSSENKRVTAQVLDPEGEVRGGLSGFWHRSLTATGTSICGEIWQRRPNPEGSEKYYNFTHFAMSLNQASPDLLAAICPTDSRIRSDQRAMEEGRFEDANRLKLLLEQKQRDTRKLLESQPGFVYQPQWFRAAVDGDTGSTHWEYTGRYWEARSERSWANVPSIFLDDEKEMSVSSINTDDE